MSKHDWQVGERCWVYSGCTIESAKIRSVIRGHVHVGDRWGFGYAVKLAHVFATRLDAQIDQATRQAFDADIGVSLAVKKADAAKKRLAALRAKGGRK